MIALLRGTVESISKDSIVVASAGSAFAFIPRDGAGTPGSAGQAIELFTHLHVAKTSCPCMVLPARKSWRCLNCCLECRCWPQSAMAVLASGPPDVLRAAIANEQADVLTRVPGVGTRTAKAIILHLKDKVGGGLAPAPVPTSPMRTPNLSRAHRLGYSVVEAQTALASLPAILAPVEERLRRRCLFCEMIVGKLPSCLRFAYADVYCHSTLDFHSQGSG